MGLAKLNVFISGIDDPCGIDNRTWYVTIYDCDGRVLEWCGKRYVVLPAKCGHLEVRVPPGCYYLKAVWGYRYDVTRSVIYANHFTDAAIIQACCDHTTCVKLFNPSIHRCGRIYLEALHDLGQLKLAKADLLKPIDEAINNLLRHVPRPVKEFELGHLEEIDKLVEKLAGEEAEKNKK